MNTRVLNLNSYKATLLSIAEECRKELQSLRGELFVETAADPMCAEEREVTAERIESCYRLLRHMNAALSRMERGRYGICSKCSKEIDHKWLDSVPWAMFCATCQQTVNLLHERAQAIRSESRRAA